MSLSIAIATVVLADLALIGMLAFVMSRANRLTPHARSERTSVPVAHPPAPRAAQAARVGSLAVPAGS
jgi:hypothetical protein